MKLRIALIGLSASLFSASVFAEGISVEPGLWEMNMTMEMTGQWAMTSKGDTLNGNGTMSGEAGGMKMDFKMTWDGKRVGDCD